MSLAAETDVSGAWMVAGVRLIQIVLHVVERCGEGVRISPKHDEISKGRNQHVAAVARGRLVSQARLRQAIPAAFSGAPQPVLPYFVCSVNMGSGPAMLCHRVPCLARPGSHFLQVFETRASRPRPSHFLQYLCQNPTSSARPEEV